MKSLAVMISNGSKGEKMKIFYLNRTEDESGVSGTGRVAQGFIFDNGKVAVTWLSEHPSVTVYDSIGEVHAIHGHGGKTEVIMEPDYKKAFGELKSFVDNFSLYEIAVSKLTPDSPASKLMSKV
jgi:hypothetical protein